MPKALFSLALALLYFSPFSVLSQDAFDRAADYTCPPGFLPINRGNSDTSPIICDLDQCYNDMIGCGPGEFLLVCFQ